jgi:hypothetical protein
MAGAPTPSLIPVLSEHSRALGHLLDRGRLGWKCFDDCDISLGIFPTADEAVEVSAYARIAQLGERKPKRETTDAFGLPS